MSRGILTESIQKKAKDFLGREINQTELRLIPYIQYVMVNEQKIDIRKINAEERKILRLWKDGGHIQGGAGSEGLSITKEFWDFMCEILWLAYVCV